MLEIKQIRQNLAAVEAALASRGQGTVLEPFRAIDELHRRALQEIEDLRHRRNVVTEEIARMKMAGANAEAMVLEMRTVSGRIKELERALGETEEQLNDLLMGIPNLPHASVPVGRDSADNPVVKTWREPPRFDFEAKPHWDIGTRLGILDFERAAKITGARFPLYLGAGARAGARADQLHAGRAHRASTATRKSFRRSSSTGQSMTGTGQLPKFEEDLFKLEQWDYYLIPTAEVPVTNIHRDEILDEEELPLNYTAYTPCFRSRGRLLRQGHPRPDPPAPVQQGRARQILPPRELLRRAGTAAGRSGVHSGQARPPVPGGAPVHGGHGVFRRQDLRHRGLDAGPGNLPGDFVLQQFRGLPGPARRTSASGARARRAPNWCTP